MATRPSCSIRWTLPAEPSRMNSLSLNGSIVVILTPSGSGISSQETLVQSDGSGVLHFFSPQGPVE